MARLGISIYPDRADVSQNKAYIDQAAKLGFKRVFTCFLSAEGSPDEIKARYAELCGYAHDKGLEVIIDVAPSVFDRLGISYTDLKFFHDIHVSGIRLDEGFDGQKEAMMTLNPYGLKIEVNASQLNCYVDNILSYCADPDKIIACHNFYPQKYTGLGLKLFNQCNDKVKQNRLKVAAFVTSQNPQSFGPWPLNEGLCTLEMHRDLPLELQARHLFASGMDDVIISNCFPTDEEMEQLGKINPGILTLKMHELVELSEVEKEIAYHFDHHVRGDMSDYMARSTFPRITYAKADIPAKNCTEQLRRGDVVILNNNYGRYKGELHIILQDMPNEGNKNHIGHINENEMFMLDFITPWKPFALIR